MSRRDEKMPPNDREAEACVLGSMILDRDAIDKARGILQPDDFYCSAHQEIFRRILALHDSGTGLDLVTLRVALEEAKVLERVGGIKAVLAIAEAVPTSANVVHYAEIVRDRAVRRRLIATGTQITADAHGFQASGQELVEHVQRQLDDIAQLDGHPRIDKDGDGEAAVRDLRNELDAVARGERRTLPFPWPRLTDASKALRPKTVTILAGPAGYGKTFFGLQVAVHVRRAGQPCLYLPLEGSRVDVARRLLAHLAGDWSVIDDEPDRIDDTINKYFQHCETVTRLSDCILENPRLSHDKGLSSDEIGRWCAEVARETRVIIIDPVAQIDFPDKEPWKAQAAFMRRISKTAAATGCSIVLVAHTVKRTGAAAKLPLSGEDVQGASEFVRLADNVLLLDAHEERSSEVLRPGGCRETVLHDRTLIVAKARYGPGRGLRLAFRMVPVWFDELGVIAPASRGSSRGESPAGRQPYKDDEETL